MKPTTQGASQKALKTTPNSDHHTLTPPLHQSAPSSDSENSSNINTSAPQVDSSISSSFSSTTLPIQQRRTNKLHIQWATDSDSSSHYTKSSHDQSSKSSSPSFHSIPSPSPPTPFNLRSAAKTFQHTLFQIFSSTTISTPRPHPTSATTAISHDYEFPPSLPVLSTSTTINLSSRPPIYSTTPKAPPFSQHSSPPPSPPATRPWKYSTNKK